MTIATVVPVYKHSVLLFDAIASVRNGQDLTCDIVMVDDGCPDPATMIGGLGLCALDPRVHYLRGENIGLSGARNRGIDFVLAELPDAEAIFFLDADNMLSSWSLRQMNRVLEEHSAVDWFYPDIRMFGLEWEGDYSGAYSVLAQALENICEAGSLVRRRVFEAGLRFSREMRLGLEDWDFWLSAVERGFRGRHFPGSGFRYRKRPESMLADSQRDAMVIRYDLEKRHSWMRDMRTMLALEHAECPRYAIYLRDLHVVRLTSSAVGHTEELSWSDYLTRFWQAAHAPMAYHCGGILIVTTEADLRLLVDARLWHWALSDLELRLQDSNVASMAIRPAADDRMGIDEPSNGPDPTAAFATVSTQLLREIVLDPTDHWIASINTEIPAPRISRRGIVLPPWAFPSQPQHGALQSLVGVCRDLRRSEHAASRHLPGSGMVPGSLDRSRVHLELRHRFGGGTLPASLRYDRPEVAFVVPLVEFGGVEKATVAIADALKLLGYGVSLVVMQARSVHLAAAVWRTFDRILFMDNAEFQNWSGPSYFGTNLSRWSTAGEHASEINLFSVFDVVVGEHAGDLLGLMGALRRRGVVTASHVHLFDRSALGRQIGHPVLAIAYEHALDLIIGCSQRICEEMHAMGVPRAKIVHVPNASTLMVAPGRALDILAARRARASGCLNVLFLGRLDQQKGIDRLIALHSRFSDDARVQFRIIGKSIVGDGRPLGALAALVEAPVYQSHDLIAAYAWADVIVLPSLNEGLPLTLLEGMSLGVVPIVSRAGGVEEAVRDGIDGWVVGQEDCVREMTGRIEKLIGDRQCLRAMSDAAWEAMQDRNWNRSVKDLDGILRRLISAGRHSRDALHTALLLPHGEAGDSDVRNSNQARVATADPTASHNFPASVGANGPHGLVAGPGRRMVRTKLVHDRNAAEPPKLALRTKSVAPRR
jgi:glycosyltransferase involved in cell wall biosynthesis